MPLSELAGGCWSPAQIVPAEGYNYTLVDRLRGVDRAVAPTSPDLVVVP